MCDYTAARVRARAHLDAGPLNNASSAIVPATAHARTHARTLFRASCASLPPLHTPLPSPPAAVGPAGSSSARVAPPRLSLCLLITVVALICKGWRERGRLATLKALYLSKRPSRAFIIHTAIRSLARQTSPRARARARLYMM